MDENKRWGALYANRKHDGVGETVQDDKSDVRPDFSKRVGLHPVVDARLLSYVVCLRIEKI